MFRENEKEQSNSDLPIYDFELVTTAINVHPQKAQRRWTASRIEPANELEARKPVEGIIHSVSRWTLVCGL